MNEHRFAIGVFDAREQLRSDGLMMGQQAANVLAAIRWLTEVGDLDRAATLTLDTRLPLAGALGYRPLIGAVDELLDAGYAGSERASLLRWRGVLLHRLGATDDAVTAWERAMEDATGDARALTEGNLAHALRELGDHERSLELLRDAEADAVTVHARLSAQVQRSATQIWTGDIEAALATVERARATAAQGDEADPQVRDALCYVHLNESVAYEITGAFERARSSAATGLLVARELASVGLEARLLGQIALALTWLGRHPAAIGASEEALALSRDVGDARMVDDSLGTVALCLWRAGRHDEIADLPAARAPRGWETLCLVLALVQRGDGRAARRSAIEQVAHLDREERHSVELGDALICLAVDAEGPEQDQLIEDARIAYERTSHWRARVLPEYLDLAATPPSALFDEAGRR